MKRILGMLLAAAFIFSGCGTDNGKPDADMAADNETTEQVFDADNKRNTFSGRYVEADITPKQAGNGILNIWITDNGLVCRCGDEYYITGDGGASWAEMDTSWSEALDCDHYSVLFVEDDGTVWLQASTFIDSLEDGNSYANSLWRIEHNGQPERFGPSADADVASFDKVRPLPYGKALVQYYTLDTDTNGLDEHIEVFDVASRELLYEVKYDQFAYQGVVHVSDGFIYYFDISSGDTTGFTAKKFDPSDGAELDSYPNILPRDGFYFRNWTNGPLEVARDNLYYVNQQQGINRVAMGGSIPETILEYDLYSCQGKGMDVYDLLIDEQNTLYVISRSIEHNPAAPDRLYKYYYDPDVPYYDDNRNQAQSATYYVERNPGENNSSIYAALPAGETVVVVADAHQIQAENENYLVFTRTRIDGEVQTQPATLTLHYFDKAKDEVRDIFTDTWEEWGVDYRLTAGVVLGAVSGDKEWSLEHPNYMLADGKLQFYLSYIEENKTEQYLFDFITESMVLQDTIDWEE